MLIKQDLLAAGRLLEFKFVELLFSKGLKKECFIRKFNILIFFICIFIYSGCYNSSTTFCQNLSKEYDRLLKQNETIKIHSWNNLYVHHEFLAKPLLENYEESSVEKERLFSITFRAFLRSRSALKCGVEPKENMTFSEKRVPLESAGLTKIETEPHPYFKCLLSEWKENAKSLIFKSCKYYFTH